MRMTIIAIRGIIYLTYTFSAISCLSNMRMNTGKCKIKIVIRGSKNGVEGIKKIVTKHFVAEKLAVYIKIEILMATFALIIT